MTHSTDMETLYYRGKHAVRGRVSQIEVNHKDENGYVVTVPDEPPLDVTSFEQYCGIKATMAQYKHSQVWTLATHQEVAAFLRYREMRLREALDNGAKI